MKYTPFYIKTHHSLLHSMIEINELIKYAVDHNIQALTITDDNMYGVMEFYHACKKNSIKPIVGLEIELNKSKIVLYAKDYIGYKNLLKINTSITDLTIEILAKHSAALICLLPYESTHLYDVLNKVYENTYTTYSNLEEKKQLNQTSIYMNEILYLDSSDKNYLKYLHAIKKGVTFEEITNYKGDYSIISKEIDIELNKQIAQMCNLELEFNQDLMPVFETPNGIDTFIYLKQLCKEGLKRIFGDVVLKTYIERLKYELEIINKMGFSNYFLVVYDYIEYAKKNNILVGPGRGSAAGSLVAYCLNITTIDPIKYNLLFERFLNPERISMPDIDIDFEDTRREEVINYCINKYGFKRVAPIITFGTMASKQVIRDVARTMNVDLKTVDSLIKMLNPTLTLKDNYKANVGIREYISKRNELTNLYRVASKFEGLKRHSSIHAAGIVMSKYDLDDVIPIDNKHTNFFTTSYSMEYLEEIGLLKMDFLGLKNLTLIKEIINKVDSNLDFDSIPLDDADALKIFTNVETVGIFQFESPGMVSFLKKLEPNSFEDIFAAIALFRPGPMNNIDSYVKRKKGLEKIDYFHPNLEPILKNTYGIVVYQEQIMQIANVMAGYNYGEADVLRKAMSKKKEEVMLREKKTFVERSIPRGYNEELAVRVYDLILKFASYGFNRAHSVSYAMISYKMAFLKAKYPEIFMQCLLTMVNGSETKTKEYISECKRMGITILPPDIMKSQKSYASEDKAIRFPLTGIKGLGSQIVNSIIEERNKSSFLDIFDFIKRVYGKNCNKKILESLVLSGALASFKINKKTLIENLDSFINYAEILKDLDSKFVLKPVIKNYPEYETSYILSKEVELLGIYVSSHPLSKLKTTIPNLIDIAKISDYFDKTICALVIIDSIRETTTKKGEKMAFATASDEFRSCDLILFPTVYEKLEVGEIYLIEGKVEKRFSKIQVVVSNIKRKSI